jgi:GTPase SAR1 family protein
VPRINIGVFGVMNAGKSTLMNAITRQETSIVDATPGTTAGELFGSRHLLGVQAGAKRPLLMAACGLWVRHQAPLLVSEYGRGYGSGGSRSGWGCSIASKPGLLDATSGELLGVQADAGCCLLMAAS